MTEITYIRTSKHGRPDFAGAVVEIVSEGVEPLTPGATSVQKEGWALKQGFNFSTWKKRYLRLSFESLKYFKREREATIKGTIPLSAYCIAKAVNPGDERASNGVAYVKLVNGMPAAEKIQKPHGLALSVPEAERTYYLFFVNDRQRDEWLEAVATNIELHRRAHGKIEEMIDRVVPLAETGAVPWDKIGIVKMALRSRFQSKLNVLTGGPFITALKLCALGDETGLRTSLKREAVNEATGSGTTLLIKGCTVGRPQIVRYLLEMGADPNQAKEDGDTPLIIAARLNHVDIVRLLLDYGADRGARNSYEETALSEARHKDGLVSELLQKHYPKEILKPRSSSEGVPSISVAVSEEGGEAGAAAAGAAGKLKKQASMDESHPAVTLDVPRTGSLRRLSESLKNRRMSLSREEISRMTIKEEDIEAEAKKMDDDADSDSDDDGDLPDSGAADKA